MIFTAVNERASSRLARMERGQEKVRIQHGSMPGPQHWDDEGDRFRARPWDLEGQLCQHTACFLLAVRGWRADGRQYGPRRYECTVTGQQSRSPGLRRRRVGEAGGDGFVAVSRLLMNAKSRHRRASRPPWLLIGLRVVLADARLAPVIDAPWRAWAPPGLSSASASSSIRLLAHLRVVLEV